MTSIEEFTKIAKVLKSAYTAPNFLPDNYAVKLWHSMLCDISFDMLTIAVQQYIIENRFPPTVADIRMIALENKDGHCDWSEGWGSVKSAIRRFGMYRETEAIASFDEVTADTVKRIGWQNICQSQKEEGTDRAQFRMIYEQVANRHKQARLMPNKLKMQIADMRNTALIEEKERGKHERNDHAGEGKEMA